MMNHFVIHNEEESRHHRKLEHHGRKILKCGYLGEFDRSS